MPILWGQDFIQTAGCNDSCKSTMSYKCIIHIDDSKKRDVLKSEFKDLKTDRFQIKIDEEVIVTAEDAVALRAALNSVCKALYIFDKTKEIK
jgi:tRNA threonylcarbamoyladenosine modification (KEOPS) complex  Pcc1 subunit